MVDIDSNAPVIASAEARISAPVSVVWVVQSDIAGWPQWNPEVSSVEVDGPIAPGTKFRWKSHGLMVAAELLEVQPERAIAWAGHTFGISARHLWTFQEQGFDVVVRTRESLGGLLPRLLRSVLQRMLQTTLLRDVSNLKSESERRVQ